jgi:hypothetical protein
MYPYSKFLTCHQLSRSYFLFHSSRLMSIIHMFSVERAYYCWKIVWVYWRYYPWWVRTKHYACNYVLIVTDFDMDIDWDQFVTFDILELGSNSYQSIWISKKTMLWWFKEILLLLMNWIKSLNIPIRNHKFPFSTYLYVNLLLGIPNEGVVACRLVTVVGI